MRRDTPEPWAKAMRKTGAVAPNGAPSITRLAAIAGISVETARRVLYGMGDAKVETINAIAAALRMDVRKVSEWAEQSRSVAEPFQVPAEADLLTDKERRAITSLIRAITDGRRRSNETSQEQGSQARGTSEQSKAAIAAEKDRLTAELMSAELGVSLDPVPPSKRVVSESDGKNTERKRGKRRGA